MTPLTKVRLMCSVSIEQMAMNVMLYETFHTGKDVVLKGHLPVNALVFVTSLYALSTEDSYVNL